MVVIIKNENSPSSHFPPQNLQSSSAHLPAKKTIFVLMSHNNDKRLFLIDAYAMIFRGYYALIRNPRLTSKGLDTSAIFGFTNSLIELIRRESCLLYTSDAADE